MPFEPIRAARMLLRSTPQGALGTIDQRTGAPFVSLVTVATSVAGEPILLLSSLAAHTRNLAADSRASLLLTQALTSGDPLALSRLTLIGEAAPVDATANASVRERFLARHPAASGYVDLADFRFHALKPQRGHLVAGFGRIAEIDGAALLVDDEDPRAEIADEESGGI